MRYYDCVLTPPGAFGPTRGAGNEVARTFSIAPQVPGPCTTALGQQCTEVHPWEPLSFQRMHLSYKDLGLQLED